jgi:hypothetical protein
VSIQGNPHELPGSDTLQSDPHEVALNSPAQGGPFGLPTNIKTGSAVTNEPCTEQLQGGAFVPPINTLTTKTSAATESVGLAEDSPETVRR